MRSLQATCPNNCSGAAEKPGAAGEGFRTIVPAQVWQPGKTPILPGSRASSYEQLFMQDGCPAREIPIPAAGSRDNLLPFRTIVRSRCWISRSRSRFRGGDLPETEQFPDYTPIQPDHPDPAASPNNSSVSVHTPCLSKYASFWVLRYFALSSLGLYGWLWLFSCVSVLCLGIPVVLPVFRLLSYCLCVHVVHELCLQATQ